MPEPQGEKGNDFCWKFTANIEQLTQMWNKWGNQCGRFPQASGLLSLLHARFVLLRDEQKPQKTRQNLCGTEGMARGAMWTAGLLTRCAQTRHYYD